MRVKWAGNVERVGWKRNSHRILVEKPEKNETVDRRIILS
jgi:hypothetical protein